MARVPISFYLNILAGILVLFNHYVASQTGDVALNKVTGAAGRFYTLFWDSALTLQHALDSRLETIVCGTSLDNHLPHDTVVHLRTHYCHALAHEPATSTDRQPRGGYGGSNFAFVHHPPIQPLVPTTTKSPFILDQSTQHRPFQAAWRRSGEVMAEMGTLFLRTCLSCWWFREPRAMTGILLVVSSVMLILDHVFWKSTVMQRVSQMYMVSLVDFLQCIAWGAQHWILDLGVVVMEWAYGFGRA